MKYIILIIFIIFLAIGCDDNSRKFRVREIQSLQVNTKLHPSWLHKDIVYRIHKQTLSNSVYKIWYADAFVFSGHYYITIRNSDSLITSIWRE